MSGILLSISILISNRPDTVEKCLRSLASLRQKVSSELILVDTGCGEQVRKIIEPYADKIVESEWCNDFSKARNAGVRQAKGEWFLYLDDDEWFEDTEEIENFFLSDQHLSYHCGSYLQRNYFNQEGTKYRDEYVGRLIRLEPDTEFVYSIHEGFSKVREPRIRLHSYVHHYGYAFRNEEEARKHSQRNISLLLAEHEKDPAELRHSAQLAQEYNALQEWEKSIEISLEGIYDARPGISAEQFLGGLYVNVVRNYVTLGQCQEAIEKGEEYLGLGYSNELARAAARYNLCIAYLEIEEYVKSLKAVEGYLDFYEKWKADRDATAFYECLTVPFLSEGCRQAALCIGIQAAGKLGNSALAKYFFDKIDWKALENVLMTQSVRGMIQTLVRVWSCTEAEAARDYTNMMGVLLKDRTLAGLVLTEMDVMCKETPELLQTKKANWAALADKKWISLYLKLKNKVESDRDILTKDYCNLWREPVDSLMRAKDLELWEMALQDNVDMGQVLSSIPLYRWEKAVRTAVEKLEWEDAEEMQGHLKEVLDADSFHMLYGSIPYRMRKIQMMVWEKEESDDTSASSIENIIQELIAYATENERLCRRLFREELFEEMPELLPRECQVSLKLLDMSKAVSEKDFQRGVSDVRDALEMMPELSDVLKYCTRWISEKSAEQKSEQESARQEMRKLAEAVKGQIRSLAAQGMLTEAAGVLGQLKALMPGDEEVGELEREIAQRMPKKYM